MAGHLWEVKTFKPVTVSRAAYLFRVAHYQGMSASYAMKFVGYALERERQGSRYQGWLDILQSNLRRQRYHKSNMADKYTEGAARIMNQLAHSPQAKSRGCPVDCPWEVQWDWFGEYTKLFKPTYGVGAYIRNIRVDSQAYLTARPQLWADFPDPVPTWSHLEQLIREERPAAVIVECEKFIPVPLNWNDDYRPAQQVITHLFYHSPSHDVLPVQTDTADSDQFLLDCLSPLE